MKNLKVTIGKTTKARSFESLSEKEKTSLHFKRVKKNGMPMLQQDHVPQGRCLALL